MNNNQKRFSYLEGYPLIFLITIIGLFFWNFTDGGRAFAESMLSTNIFIVLLLIIYYIITMMGGLVLILILINDVTDSLFESKNKNNPSYKTQKTVILTIIIGTLILWFFAHFVPKQDCIKNITLKSTNVYTYSSEDSKENFKSRNDALDYCMAQRWGS